MQYKIFKQRLEQLCGIAAWAPTEDQLEAIAQRFVSNTPENVVEAKAIVQEACPRAIYLALEGADNSDLRALLALAIAAAKG